MDYTFINPDLPFDLPLLLHDLVAWFGYGFYLLIFT